MMKFLILPFTVILASFSSIAQVERSAQSIVVPIVQGQYYGCCNPVRNFPPSSCSMQTVQKETETQESQQSLDVTDPELSGVEVTPNPTKGHVSVSVPASLIGYEIQIIDMTGRMVGKPTPITGVTEKFKIEGESGVYLILIRTEKEIITERILLSTH